MVSPSKEDNPTVCPYCSSGARGCAHLFAVVDITFSTVDGPAAAVFNNALRKVCDPGVAAEAFEGFVDTCQEICPSSGQYENYGDPGMSSLEYWFWSDDVLRDIRKLRETLVQ